MVSDALNSKISQMAQHCGLTPNQARACDSLLEQHMFLPYLKFFSQGDALGLSSFQWMKAYLFKQRFENLSHQEEKAFDLSPSLPLFSQAYDPKNLLLIAYKIIEHPDEKMETFLSELGLSENEEVLKAIQYALAIHLLQQSPLIDQLRLEIWEKGLLSLTPKPNPPEHIKALYEQWPNPAPLIKNVDSLLFLKFWQAQKSRQVNAEWMMPDHPQWLFDQLAQHLGWSPKNQPLDGWIEEALKLAVNVYFYPKLYRDLMGLCYDQAVEQLLPLVEVQWRQLLKIKGIGAKQILMFYPHGKSGVMILLINEQGQILQDFTIYPHAPDYQIENSVAEIAKILTRHPVEHIGWLVQIETKSAIQKLLKMVKERYPDIHWQIHHLSNRLTPMFSTAHSKKPDLNEVVKAPQFLQNPWYFWKNCQPELFLNPALRLLPKERLHFLWHMLVQETLLLEGIDVNQAPQAHFEILEILQPEDIHKIIDAREQNQIDSHTKMQEILKKEPEDYAKIAPFLRIGNHLDYTPFHPKAHPIIKAILTHENCNLVELIEKPETIQHALQHQTLQEKFGYDALYQIYYLLKEIQDYQKPHFILTAENKQNLAQIRSGTRFVATIQKILNYGCFVDLGEGIEGLLHISAIGDCFINDLSYIFQPGDLIFIDWLHYDEDKKRLSLGLHHDKIKYKPLVQKNPRKKIENRKTKAPEKQPNTIGPSAMQLAFSKLKNKD